MNTYCASVSYFADRKWRQQCSIRIFQSCKWAVIFDCPGRWRSLTFLVAWNHCFCLVLVDCWVLNHLSMPAPLISAISMTNASERKVWDIYVIFFTLWYINLLLFFYLFIDNLRFIGQIVPLNAFTRASRAKFRLVTKPVKPVIKAVNNGIIYSEILTCERSQEILY